MASTGSNSTKPSCLFGLLCCTLIVAAIWFLLPTVGGGPAAKRSICKNNLKHIGLALQNYHETYGRLPPQYTVNQSGRRLLSWRVLILPYLDQMPLYRVFDLDSAWNEAQNRPLSEEWLVAYQCPAGGSDAPITNYLAVTESPAWNGSGGVTVEHLGAEEADIPLVVEVSRTDIPWAKPADISAAAKTIGNVHAQRMFSPKIRYANVLFLDGHVESFDVEDPNLKRRLAGKPGQR